MSESTFWNMVPVKRGDGVNDKYKKMGIINCCIDPDFDENESKLDKMKLPKGYKWRDFDINDDDDMDLILDFLNTYYYKESKKKDSKKKDSKKVSEIIFNSDYLYWLLDCPIDKFQSELLKKTDPSYWTFGVVLENNPDKIVGLILSSPIRYKLVSSFIETFKIDCICVHPKLREKQLTAVIMKEMSVRIQKLGLASGAIFSTEKQLSFASISSPNYIYVPLNIKKLFEQGKVKQKDVNMLLEKFKVDKTPAIASMNALTSDDIPELIDYMISESNKYQLGHILYQDEFEHYFLSYPDIVKSYFFRDPITGKITDFISFYIHTTKEGDKHAYLYYILQTELPINIIIRNTLFICKELNLDYFFILDVFGIYSKIVSYCNFIPSNIKKNYYLWNYNIDYIYPNQLGMILP